MGECRRLASPATYLLKGVVSHAEERAQPVPERDVQEGE